MKTIIATLTLSLFAGTTFAQKIKESEVPAAVKDSFSKKYSGAKVEKWEKENNNYEAEFDLNKAETSALFDASGNFKEQEQEIKTSALPAGVTDYCARNFAGWKLSEASKITSSEGKISYEAEMKKGKEHFDAIFNEQGNFEKKSEVEKGKEEKD